MIHGALIKYSKRDLNPHSRNGHGILSPISCFFLSVFNQFVTSRFSFISTKILLLVQFYSFSWFNILLTFCIMHPLPVRIQSADTPNSRTIADIHVIGKDVRIPFSVFFKFE